MAYDADAIHSRGTPAVRAAGTIRLRNGKASVGP
jgi:hypothetical protein